MDIKKHLTITGYSTVSWKDATVKAIAEASKTIDYLSEVKILEQLCDGKVYQKEVEGFSENTVYRKLKAARERNGNITREQLIDLFKKERMGRKSSEKTFRQI